MEPVDNDGFFDELSNMKGNKSKLNDGLSCEYLNEDETCDYSDMGCWAWGDWNLEHRKEREPIENFCRLPVKERDEFSA